MSGTRPLVELGQCGIGKFTIEFQVVSNHNDQRREGEGHSKHGNIAEQDSLYRLESLLNRSLP